MGGPKASLTRGRRAAFMVLDTVPTALALNCANVLGVARVSDWTDSLPVPFGLLVPTRFAASEPESVVRIGTESRSVATIISGTIRIEYLPTDALIGMPAGGFCGFQLFSNVALADGRLSALVVNIDALFQVHRELGN